MRTINELLIVLRQCVINNRDKSFPDEMICTGLCELIGDMVNTDIINLQEEVVLLDYLYDNRPKNLCNCDILEVFFWPMHKIKPRLRWLTINIKKTTK